MVEDILKDADERMNKAVEAIARDLGRLRTGKATHALLEGIKVDYYGTELPINQVASIAIPEARLLVIQPWDKNAIDPIVKAIQASELGLPPQSDGNVIRIAIPALSEERRQGLTKLVGKVAEEGKISIRNIRRDAIDTIKKLQNDGDIPEDRAKKGVDEVQKITDKATERIDELKKRKEEEVLSL
ncbi:ribosome recycling factor [bacterium]|nr:MAG: ribosome recycling factor [bacterium]